MKGKSINSSTVTWVYEPDTERKMTAPHEVLHKPGEQVTPDFGACSAALVFENMLDAVMLTDLDGRIIEWNPAAERMFGYSRAEVLGQSPGFIHLPQDRPNLQEKIQETVIQPERWFGEIPFKRKDGSLGFSEVVVSPLVDEEGKLFAILGVNRDITERKKANEKLLQSEERYRRQAREMALLDRVRTALARQVDLDEVMRTVVKGVVDSFGYSQVSILMLQEGALWLKYQVGYPQIMNPIPLNRGVSGRVARTGQAVLLEDVHSDPDYIGELEDTLSEVCVPFLDDGQVLGILNIESGEGIRLGEDDLRLMTMLSEHIVLAIRRARLFDEIQHHARNTALLNAIAGIAIHASNLGDMLKQLADRVGERFTAEGVYVTLWDNENQRPLPVAAYGAGRDAFLSLCTASGEKTISESVLNAGRVLAFEDLETSPFLAIFRRLPVQHRSAMALPLIADNRRLGMVIMGFDHVHHFTPEEVSLGEQVANQVALATARFQALEAEQRRSAQLARANSFLTALSQVAMQIERAPNVHGVMETLGDELEKLGLHCLIALYDAVDQTLVVDYLSHGARARSLSERLADTCFAEVRFPAERFPFYEEMKKGQRGIFSQDTQGVLRTILPGLSASRVQRIASVMGVTPITRGFFLYLSAEEKPLGVLWIWGEDLQQSDLPAALLFASQVAVALENARLYSEVQQMAITDELTGIFNRRGLINLGRREVERALRFSRPLSALMIDIDHFKEINDQYGHAEGDQVLRALAEQCRQYIRDVDILGRYGGEEFVILLPESDTAQATQVAERLRNQVSNRPTPTADRLHHITVSIGVKTLDRQVSSLEELLAAADEALYQAKRAGRDQVIVI